MPAQLKRKRGNGATGVASFKKRRTVRVVRSGRAALTKESGYVDLAAASYAMNTTGSLVLIPTVAQGVSVNERIGKKLRWKSMQIRGSVVGDTACLTAAGAYLIVYDKRPQGSLPAITDILDTANQKSFNKDENSGRFRIVRRKDFAVTGNSATAGQNTSDTNIVVNDFIDLKGMPAEYMAAGTGAIGDYSLGALYLVTVGNIAAGTGDAVAGLGIRTRFMDD